jgi:hypothetical protein
MILSLTSQFDINQQGESLPDAGDDDAGEDDDGGVHNDVKDAVPREGGAETAQRKKGKTSSKKREKARESKKGAGDRIFGDVAPLNSLTRRAVLIRTCAPYAVEVAEAVNHESRMRGAKRAFEAWNIHGLSDKAPELMNGDFLHSNLYGVALNLHNTAIR